MGYQEGGKEDKVALEMLSMVLSDPAVNMDVGIFRQSVCLCVSLCVCMCTYIPRMKLLNHGNSVFNF